MKVVITKDCPELNLKAGTRTDVDNEQWTLLEKQELAVRASEWDAQQSVIKANERIKAAAEAAIDGAIVRARGRGTLLPKEDAATIRADALDFELAKPGKGVSWIEGLPVKAGDTANLGKRITASEGLETGTIRGCEPSLKEYVQGYIQASEPFSKKLRQGGLIRCCGTGEQATKAIQEATEASRKKSAFVSQINSIMAKSGGDVVLEDVVKAANYVDPGSTAATTGLGSLNSDLVLQWNLGHLENMLPILDKITTNVSNQPVLYMQEALTRYVIVPGYQKKTGTTAWSTANKGNTVDVNVQMNNFIGIPISINNTILAATYRQLFNEQRVPQIYGVAEGIVFQIVDTIVNGTTRINNDLTTTAGKKHNPAYVSPTLAGRHVFNAANATLATFLSDLPLAMNTSKFPGGQEPPGAAEVQRFAWLHPSIYALMPRDGSFVLAQTIRGLKDPSRDVIGTGTFDRVGNVDYAQSQLMSDLNVETSDGQNPATYTITQSGDISTATVVGFAGTRSSLLFTSRVPLDYTKVLPEIPSTAAVELVTTPKLQLTLMVVKFLDHLYETANMRAELMFGVAVGDERQGMQIVVK